MLLFATALMAGQCVFAQKTDPQGPVFLGEPTETTYGTCGDPTINNGESVSYVYEPSTHTLTISGTGPMRDQNLPWAGMRTGYVDCITTVVIETGVTTIGEMAFDGGRNITSVTLPNTITRIGIEAFYMCESLEAITIPNGVSTICENAFEYCSSLESVSIPASVTAIGPGAFSGCSSLTSITVDGENMNYKGITGVLLSRDGKTVVAYPSGKTDICYEIPAGVTRIENYAFKHTNHLTSIIIPSTVITIGDFTFAESEALTTVYFDSGSGLKNIGDGAFSECENLATINFPESVTTIGYNVVYDTPWLNNQPEGLAYVGKIVCGFKGNGTSAIIADGTLAICPNAFYDNSNLVSVTIPASVKSIGEYAFAYCTALESIVIPAGVTTIDYGTFERCEALESVVFAGGSLLDTIMNCAFQSCYNLSSIIIPDKVKSIGEFAFSYCNNLTSIVIPSSVEEIGEGVCYNSKNVEDVYCFADPSKLTWSERYYYRGFKDDGSTKCHVADVSLWASDADRLNLSFESDLNQVAYVPVWNVDVEHDGTTAEKAYIISSTDGLDLLAALVNGGEDFTDTYFKLGNDITYSYDGLGPTESNYTSIVAVGNDPQDPLNPIYKVFNGIFDGDGKYISGIRIYSDSDNQFDLGQGIFKVVGPDGVIRNLTVDDTKVTAAAGVAGIVSIAAGCLIENCTSYADLLILTNNQRCGMSGGIVAATESARISDCTSYSTITVGDDAIACQYIGGIVGMNMGDVDNCYSYGTITMGDDAYYSGGFGGIAGMSDNGVISNCVSSVAITVGDNPDECSNFGGIIGYFYEGNVSDNIAIGATVPDLGIAGAVAGFVNNEYTILENNYYSNCTVGANTDNIGHNGSDVDSNDGAVQATILIDTEDAPTTLANGEKVVYRREFKQGVSSTVCLPVAIDAAQASAAGKFFTFAGVDMTDPDDWAVVMQEVAGNMVAGELEANTPYLFIPDADGPVMFVVEADGSSVAAGSAVDGNWTFAGTYDSIVWNAGNANLGKVYGFAAQKYEAPDGDGDSNPDYTINPGKFVMAGAGACIAPYRAYLTYNAPQNAPSRTGSRASQQLPGSMKVILLGSNGVETAVGRIDAATGNVSIDTWYDMNGRQIDGAPAKGGMYIHGGKTIMINK